MTRITPELLRAVMPNVGERAERFAPLLAQACPRFNIDTPARVAAFLATIAHESQELLHMKEVWGPTAAQLRYEGRKDLGNTEPGDGKRFAGRGAIQVTGRDNYTRLSKATGTDYVQFPVLLERDRDAVIGSCWWWQAHGCNELADTGSIEAVTRKVNGAQNGIEDRRRYFKRAVAAVASTTALELPVQPDQIDHGLIEAFAVRRERDSINHELLAEMAADGSSTAPPPVASAPLGWASPDGDPLAPAPYESKPMIPAIVAAVLPSIINAVPELIKLFNGKEKLTDPRYEKLGEHVINIAQGALGAVNAQDVAEKLQVEPAAAETLRAAVKSEWFELQKFDPEQAKFVLEQHRMDQQDRAASMADTVDARHTFSDSKHVFWLGIVVLTKHLAIALMALAGAFYLLFTPSGTNVDKTTLAVLMGLIGTIVGTVGTQASQVISFNFGSSWGSKRAGEAVRAMALKDKP